MFLELVTNHFATNLRLLVMYSRRRQRWLVATTDSPKGRQSAIIVNLNCCACADARQSVNRAIKVNLNCCACAAARQSVNANSELLFISLTLLMISDGVQRNGNDRRHNHVTFVTLSAGLPRAKNVWAIFLQWIPGGCFQLGNQLFVHPFLQISTAVCHATNQP